MEVTQELCHGENPLQSSMLPGKLGVKQIGEVCSDSAKAMDYSVSANTIFFFKCMLNVSEYL